MTNARHRLSALRQALKALDLDGFLVPRTDAYQNEYLPASEERLAWLTGFTGSAGLAVVLSDQAALFVDGRYTVQARQEVDGDLFTQPDGTAHPGQWAPGVWLSDHLGPDARLGYDPALHTRDDRNRLIRICDGVGANLVAVAINPIDGLWTDRPLPPRAPLVPHPLQFAGLDSAVKREQVAARLRQDGQHAAVLTAPDSIAWLFNIRGDDIPFTPYPLCYAIIRDDGDASLFVEAEKLPNDLPDHLGPAVALESPAGFEGALQDLGAAARRVRVDPALTPCRVIDALSAHGAVLCFGDDPCRGPKACKNSAERAGARAAHRRDGAALARFLCWLEEAAAAGGLGEYQAAEKLQSFRAEGEHYRGDSFPAISGAGPNGAIVHYRVTPDGQRRLQPGQLYLLDSGGQYLDGTTDVTRTMLIGDVVAHDALHFEKQCFTRVLQGHIALSMARFPRGTTGGQLDSLARRPLWEMGLDYNHGTGHGVGSYLSVHEGPQRISKAPDKVPLMPGMVVSNEPGFYLEGRFGIRIENLQMVVDCPGHECFPVPFHGFETLTLVPIDTRLIDADLLAPQEKSWLNDYHSRVLREIAPLVDAQTADWLGQKTRAIA